MRSVSRHPFTLALLLVLGCWPVHGQGTAPAPADPVVEAPPFEEWLQGLVAEALDRGFDPALVESTLADLEPLPRVIAADRSQAELNPGFARYLSGRLTKVMVRRGQEMEQEHGAVLRRIERDFHVQGRFLLAIWGIESGFGRIQGRTPVFRALATLAWEPRRAAFFRAQLFDALTMVQRGYIEADTMTGSWAGAMGQTQFTPSSYLQYAVDFDQDGRRDIWTSVPDALASIASYLKGFGWNGDETWGREVRLTPSQRDTVTKTIPKRPEGCYAVRNMTERRPLAEWRELGVRRADGGPLPTADIAAGLVDVGERTFLVYPNYDAILGYNCAHYYALTVALLANAIG
jgi:membrane-bound lytic murein transglycosylase B